MLADGQKAQKLKFEVLVPVISAEKPTACCSFNYHQEHFGHVFDIRTADGKVAHTACLGFGLERVVMALFKTHGFDPEEWPARGARACCGREPASRSLPQLDRGDLPARTRCTPKIASGSRRTATSTSGSRCCTRSGSTRWRCCRSSRPSTSKATSGPSSSRRTTSCASSTALDVQELNVWRPLARARRSSTSAPAS